jgi:predicted DNA-binding protein (MmcQ/YjbR family)
MVGVDQATLEPLLNRVRSLCLALPEAAEAVARGNPAFRVAGQAFAGFGMVIPWGPALRLRLGAVRQQALLRDARFFPTPHLAHRGWVSLKLAAVTDWHEVGELVWDAYSQVAPIRLRQGQRLAEPFYGL